MTRLVPIADRDVRLRPATWLDGAVLVAIDTAAVPGAWVVQFANGCRLSMSSHWRVVADSRVAVASGDHQQLFGLAEPVDAAVQLRSVIGSRPITAAAIGRDTGDLIIAFGDDVRLEALTDSTGYESWVLWGPDGTQIVGGGSGAITRCGPEQAGEQRDDEVRDGQRRRGPRS